MEICIKKDPFVIFRLVVAFFGGPLWSDSSSDINSVNNVTTTFNQRQQQCANAFNNIFHNSLKTW